MRVWSRLLVVGAIVAAVAAEEVADVMPPVGEEFDLGDGGNMEMPSNGKEDVAKPEPPVYDTLPYKAPNTPAKALLAEPFQWENLGEGNWKQVKSSKFQGVMSNTLRESNWISGDKGLKMTSDSAHHALVKQLRSAFNVEAGQPLFASMEVQYEKKVECGGAYFKLFDSSRLQDKDVTEFDENTPYSIMFGPDKCGYMTNKVHLIVKYPHPKIEGEWVEEHLADAPKVSSLSGAHQYGFALLPDGTVQVFLDGEVVLDGTMKDVFKKKFANDETIPDETDEKPSDWVDEVMIPDPEATKPEDWDEDAPQTIVDEDAVMPEGWLVDEPDMIVNPDAEKPEDWDDEEDGEWKAPMMKNPACYVGCGEWKRPTKPNPAYKGPWKAPMIENPEYKGEWKPRQIPNPNHYDIESPFSVVQPFDTLGFELWTVEAGAMFDNIIVTTKKSEYDNWLKETFQYKTALEQKNIEMKNDYEQKVKNAEMNDNDKGSKSDSDSGSSSSGFFSKLFRGAQALAAENKLIFLLSVGVPIATSGYVISRLLKRGVQSVKAAKPSTETVKTPSTPANADTTAATTEVPKKEAEAKEIRHRKGSEAGNKDEKEADTAATEAASDSGKRD
eukprot:Gregarina_sp_Pseudo_9__5227@NODE_584_length_2547_cov_99_643142_g551_i0_p1_GENE_NODE_584_length_2547_cov_99_643142_g551_i0NODE_584_length_2547_cov_99_643142_g551_i0_p1_ORF_typecomplete_len613_score205_91Calreticulin/PF00262_18/5e59Calreticulin/PF00262_18/4_8e07Calreticulin/PF00262_18/1_6e03_NODE_584_length_2547_cov_99_643142_g551_i01662004